jgi:hypothetical protein
VEEIDTAKGSSDDGVDWLLDTWNAELGLATNVGKYATFTHLDEGEFSVVAVSRIV